MLPYPRWIEQALEGAAARRKVRLLFGARQTGKSTLLKRLAPADALLLNLQDRRERLRFERQPDELVRLLRAERRGRVVVIDEIQKVPALLEEIQIVHDQAPGRFEFLLTGSSARRLRSAAANWLPGRAHRHLLFPLTRWERKETRPPELLRPGGRRTWRGRFPASDLETLLLYGGLPGVVLEPEGSRQATLESYAELYLEEEIRREALVRNTGTFSAFLELAALESGQMMNLTKLSQQSSIAISTLRVFYQILVDTFVGFWLPPFSESPRKRLLTTPSFYFFDVGVRNALARLPLVPSLLKLQAETLFQQWVVTELHHRAQYLGRPCRLSFWRTVHGAEVDVVLSTPSETIPVEVKWTENPRPPDARHVVSFLKAHPRKSRRGFVVCRVPRPVELAPGVTAIPWQAI